MPIDLTILQSRTLECIKQHFKENPITGTRLANEINLVPRDSGKYGADMRSIINALRSKGHPICAGTKGYFWPRSYDELNQYIDEFQRRIEDQQKALAGLRAIAMKKISRPEEIKDGDLNSKLNQILKATPLSFETLEKIKTLSAALSSKDNYRKRLVIRQYQQ